MAYWHITVPVQFTMCNAIGKYLQTEFSYENNKNKVKCFCQFHVEPASVLPNKKYIIS